MASIKCGNCGEHHATALMVQACYGINGYFLCTWMVEHRQVCSTPLDQDCGWCEDGGRNVVDCGAVAWLTHDGHGFECARGHSHVDAETRDREGWEYAEDREEAKQLARAGVRPVDMEGRSFL